MANPPHNGRVSEQSPWGQPPPLGGTTEGGYPPPPAQGPPVGPPAGWAPPPAKRNRAVVIAIVVAVLVVIAALVVTVVFTRGDDNAGPAGPAGTDQGTGVASGEPTTAPSSAAATAGADVPDKAIIGAGYYFELPGIGWQNALDEAQSSGLGATLDSIIILGSSLDLAQSNILVEALTAGGAPDLEALEEQWKRNLSGADGAVPDDLPDITIDGERAIGVRFTDRENVNGLLIDQVAYLTLHEGNQFSVALSLPSADDVVSEADFEEVLASWTWTD